MPANSAVCEDGILSPFQGEEFFEKRSGGGARTRLPPAILCRAFSARITQRNFNATVVVVALRLRWSRSIVLPSQFRAAFAFPRVAHGFVQSAVGAFGGIGKDAVDDLLRLRCKGRVGFFAGVDGAGELVLEIVDLFACVDGGLGGGLELRERHAAKDLVGASVSQAHHALR